MAAIHNNILACPKLHILLAVSQSQPPPPPHRPLPCCCISPLKKKRLVIKCQAAADDSSSQTLYQGIYGPWSVDSSDVREVPPPSSTPSFLSFFFFSQFNLIKCYTTDSDYDFRLLVIFGRDE